MEEKFRFILTVAIVGLLLVVPSVYADDDKRSKSRIWTFETVDNVRIPMEDREVVENAKAKLDRSNDELCMEINTKELPAGAHTVWWVLFNDPDNCIHGSGFGGARCGADDPRSVFWFAGNTVGPNGEGHFSNCVEVGGPPSQNIQCVFDSDAGECAWDNPNAEIHAIIGRYHGMAQYDDPTTYGEQISTLNGYCAEAFPDTGGCPDLQLAILPPRQHPPRQ